ncbi:Fumarate reductase (CoM/CoB) subunit A [Candidatus Lokiarchaeum ossiferum]|uniref:Fumarate reductase (CoM/CoB) subunit A n=1 Tax=Candidatus Lokiarchaeum ossiferum TaxID=2951803 RepID=A0ABY6HTU8_9ARCH|nr:Fumarate reductase (CoM/CoB) subunit A [Candidatus Lokiarchaeum sp. B-35]
MASQYHTIIIGSGAAGLSCALELVKKNIPPESILIITENLGGGTSFDAGSDKQTYYKLSIAGNSSDSPIAMAHTLFDGGAMHGDIALIEATCSTQAFMNLVSLGVPFPHDEFGTFVGYKTDNDPLQRGTSAGPLTSHLMGTHLLREVQARGIQILNHHYVIQIVKDSQGRAQGIIAVDKEEMNTISALTQEDLESHIQTFQAEFIVLATGGPSGMYGKSVYPLSQWGATSLAILAGAKLQNLTESQYGMASLKFRWNVSGTYQQVLPRYISVDPEQDPLDTKTECVEFLRDYFPSNTKLLTATFLKGYQWPFNAERIENYGSSLIDMAVHIETVIRKRRVYMDFRQNPATFTWEQLEGEAKKYLDNSGGIQARPIERLHHMNPKAIDLYQRHGIDLWKEPLEIGVCAQHCNGGITGDIWWQTSIPHLFAIGEVNGTHGVHRPGGSALNAGQVGALRAAEKIVFGLWNQLPERNERLFTLESSKKSLIETLSHSIKTDSPQNSQISQQLQEIQSRMMQAGAYIRNNKEIDSILIHVKKELTNFFSHISILSGEQLISSWKLYDALVTQFAFLTAYQDYLTQGGGSRGSFVIIGDKNSEDTFIPHPKLDQYHIKKANQELTNKIQEISMIQEDAKNWGFQIDWVERRPLIFPQGWFETVWKKFNEKKIY